MIDKQRQGSKGRIFSYLISLVNKNPYTDRLLAFILSNPLYKGVLILGSGTAVAQIVGIISMPIITRLYTPSDFGVLAVYSSLLAIIGITGTVSYHFAYTLPEKDEDAANIFGLCLVILLITTAMFAFILCFGAEFLIETFDLGTIGPYLWFLLVGFFGMGFYTILNHWAIRHRDYKRITYTKINQSAGDTATKILFGVLSFGPMGLIIGHIISQIAGIGTLLRAMLRKDMKNLRAISFRGMKNVAQIYRSFPAFHFPATFFNTMALSIPPIILLAIYDAQIAGFYLLAHTIIAQPGAFISKSMGQAYTGEASKMVREKSLELRSLYVRTLRHLSMVAVPLIGIPALCAPFLFPIIFGAVWVDAGWYCLPLALKVISGFVVSATSKLHLYGYNHWKLIFDVTRTIIVIIVFFISQLLELLPLITILIYSLTISLMYIVTIFLNLKAISNVTKSFKDIY